MLKMIKGEIGVLEVGVYRPTGSPILYLKNGYKISLGMDPEVHNCNVGYKENATIAFKVELVIFDKKGKQVTEEFVDCFPSGPASHFPTEKLGEVIKKVSQK